MIHKMIKTILLISEPAVAAFSRFNLLREFTVREIKGRFAGSFAGVLWTLINPVANICIYIFIFSLVLRIRVTVKDTGTDSFVLFFLAGFFPWLFLADTLARAPGILLGNAGLITRVVFPVEILPMAGVSAVFITNGIGFLIFLLYLGFQTGFYITWLYLFFLLFFQFFFVMGIVCLVSAACVFIRDIAELVPILVMVWFYGSPVIYPVSMIPASFHWLVFLNPMTQFLTLYRQALLVHCVDFSLVLDVAAASFAAYCFGTWIFMRLKPAFGDVL